MLSGFRAWLNSIPSRVISDADSEQEKIRKTLLIFATALIAFGSVLWLAIYWAMGIKFSATVPLTFIALSAISLAVFVRNGDFQMFRFFQLALFLFVPFVMQWSIGSYVSSSGVMLWALLAPVGAIFFHGAKESIPWFVAYVMMATLSGIFDYFLGEDATRGVSMQGIAIFFTLNFVAMSAIIYFLLSYFSRQRDKLQDKVDEQNMMLRQEQEKSERLLLNILPAPIAQRLKDRHATIADGFADVTVMFSDINDFTRMSGEKPPIVMVKMLNELFSHFDSLAEKYGLEKIKTIGDAYMVAGGLIDNPADHIAGIKSYTDAMLSMALDMLEYIRTQKDPEIAKLKLHIGIGTGPVVAGVIGIKKFIYDLWGDTVNMASRITSEAAVGTVLVDGRTYERMRNFYDFGPQVKLHIKGKGEIIAYPLIGHKAGRSAFSMVRTLN